MGFGQPSQVYGNKDLEFDGLLFACSFRLFLSSRCFLLRLLDKSSGYSRQSKPRGWPAVVKTGAGKEVYVVGSLAEEEKTGSVLRERVEDEED